MTKKQAIEIPVIEGMSAEQVTAFVKEAQAAVRADESANKKISALVRTAVKDTLEAKRADLPCLMYKVMAGSSAWSKVKTALLFSCGAYDVKQEKEKRVYFTNDNAGLLEFDAKQKLFVLRPNPQTRYEEVKREWYEVLQGSTYTSLRGRSRAATFSAREELKAFIKRMEKNRNECAAHERQLLTDVLALLQSLSNDENE